MAIVFGRGVIISFPSSSFEIGSNLIVATALFTSFELVSRDEVKSFKSIDICVFIFSNVKIIFSSVSSYFDIKLYS